MREHRLAVVVAVGRGVFLALLGLAVFMTLRAGGSQADYGEFTYRANPWVMISMYLTLACLGGYWLYCLAFGGEKDA